MDHNAAVVEELKQRIEEAKHDKFEATRARLTQSQEFILKHKKKKLVGVPKNAHWKRPKENPEFLSEAKPLKHLFLNSTELVFFKYEANKIIKYRINLAQRSYEKQPAEKTAFTYTSMIGREFGKTPARIFSHAAQTMIQNREKEFETMKEERRQQELENFRKRRKINEEKIKNMKRFVTTFAPVNAFSNVEFDKVS